MAWLYTDQWAAGFFDGEGCITIGQSKHLTPQHDLRIQVTQKATLPLKILAEEHGGKLYKMSRDCWNWKLHGLAAEKFLIRIQPFSLCKAPEITIALAFRRTVGAVGRKLPVGVTEKRMRLRDELSSLNRAT